MVSLWNQCVYQYHKLIIFFDFYWDQDLHWSLYIYESQTCLCLIFKCWWRPDLSASLTTPISWLYCHHHITKCFFHATQHDQSGISIKMWKPAVMRCWPLYGDHTGSRVHPSLITDLCIIRLLMTTDCCLRSTHNHRGSCTPLLQPFVMWCTAQVIHYCTFVCIVLCVSFSCGSDI